MKTTLLALFFLTCLFELSSCSAVYKIRKKEDSAYLHLEVQPKTAIVYIDDELYGELSSFRKGIIGCRPGVRRVQIRAEGYESEKFDLDLHSGEELTLTLNLISKLDFKKAYDDEDPRATKKRTFLKKTKP